MLFLELDVDISITFLDCHVLDFYLPSNCTKCRLFHPAVLY